MAYTVKQLATLANVSVRLLHWYDAIDLLQPAYHTHGRRRVYEEKELLMLQQILFFKELGFSLWDENLILAPKWIFQFCKDGTEFVTINGSKKIKGIDHIDMDTRFGTTPNGFLISELKIEERDQKISEIFE